MDDEKSTQKFSHTCEIDAMNLSTSINHEMIWRVDDENSPSISFSIMNSEYLISRNLWKYPENGIYRKIRNSGWNGKNDEKNKFVICMRNVGNENIKFAYNFNYEIIINKNILQTFAHVITLISFASVMGRNLSNVEKAKNEMMERRTRWGKSLLNLN